MKTLAKLKRYLSFNRIFFSQLTELKGRGVNSDGFSGVSVGAKRFWMYAESIGEFKSALYIMDTIRSLPNNNEKESKKFFFISFKTSSTLYFARKKINLSEYSKSMLYFFHPVAAFKFILKRYVSAVDPGYFISIQHHISKNLLNMLLDAGVKVFFIDIKSTALKKMGINLIGPLSRTKGLSVTILRTSGVNSLKLDVLPVSLKFNFRFGRAGNRGVTNVIDMLQCGGVSNNTFISFVSIHEKESIFILNLVKKIVSECSTKNLTGNLKFIFAPRNIKISSELFEEARKIDLNPTYYKNIRNFLKNDGIKSLIVDEYGVLDDIYLISDIVYVGKSLFKKEGGGHNVIEPASYGRAVVTGSYAINFKDIVSDMHKNNAITVVDENNFKDCLIELIKDKEFRRKMGENGSDFCLRKKDEIENYLKQYFAENIIT
ncbi:3-deoxy-D-manno-octulosonic acid transferase [Candidatus Acidulodesulfobacterium sp. H_13]|uniref:3-deoxy-D-manno-octulosonic acid transferase n=1 Tax=Candidatus Acidulodesulfobacterium sp. H_13 TaxID=3395470 RepID=UPI003AF6BCA4